MTRLFVTATAALIAAIGGTAHAAVIDTIDATNGGAGTFFVPSLGQELDSPYYREAGEDWEWMHNPIVTPYTTAALNISAYDVDEAPCGQTNCEEDLIQGFDTDTASWVNIGLLEGDDNAFSFTEFDIGSIGSLQNEIVGGLQLRILIDELNAGWLVSLSKSVITTDGEDPGNPNPGVVPLPAAGWLLLAGIAGLGMVKRRKS